MATAVPSSSTGGGPLCNGDTAVVIGGGPAGAFFAIHLLREARRLDRRIDVVIVEKRGPIGPAAECWNCRGCTFCAGGISPRLHEALEQQGLAVPEHVIQEEIHSVWIQGEWKNFPLRVPAGMRMYSVFRGSLPEKRHTASGGFDAFLLGEAVKEGAHLICGDAQMIHYAESGRPTVTVSTSSAKPVSLDAEFVAVAAGINGRSGRGSQSDSLMASIRRINPAFAPGKSRKAFIFELDAGEAYLHKHMSGAIHFIEYGSPRLSLEHTALVPKGRFLTVAMIGHCVDVATMPRDGERIVREFLNLPQISRILPGIADAPLACACFPSMAITTARSPFGDRFALIGDAVGARLNKDGIYSAHVTAHSLALTVLHEGVDRASLSKRYGRTIRWLAADNNYGRLVFAFSRVAFGSPALSRIMYQSFATELKDRDARNRPLGVVLWKIASGTADYREVLNGLCGYAVWRSVLVGSLLTLRNVVVERAIALTWGDYGRYPTVVIKEERDALKSAIAASMGSGLRAEPDFERMYAIKIKGSPEAIVKELGKFGEPAASYLNLRFVEVRRIEGKANEVGAVVRYRQNSTGWFIDLRLSRRVGTSVLVYEVSETFAKRGTLIFQIAPTEDGNSSLAIYTAFDFKKGDHLATRPLWWSFRALFPGFMHDVVWNHALCCIKEQVERPGTPQRS